jgi:sugar/nucleoside kinase (ribokinase family)
MPRFDVTIAGEINLDLVLYGLPPEMPVERELLASDFQATLGSSSAITAHNLAALGAKTGFITRAGRDPLGAIAIERLAAIGVDLSRISYTQRGTSTGITILLHHGNERHILTYPGTMFEMSVKDLDLDYLASGRHFHLSSLFLHKSLHADLPGVFRTLKSAGLTLSLDTNDDPEDRWEGALDELLDLTDILLPNAQEACRIARKSDLEEAIELLSSRVPIVAVKLGSRGALVRQGQREWRIPPIAVTPVDTIGAGDSFNAGFLSAFVRGKTPEECGVMGNRTAALSTLRPGGTEAFRDAQLLRQFMEER